MYKRLIVALIAVLFLAVGRVSAEQISAGPLSISYQGTGPVFSEANIAPGGKDSKEITVTNNGDVAHSFAIATSNVQGGLADQIMISPKVKNNIEWEMSVFDLSNLSQESKTILDSVNPGESATFDLIAYFPESAGSDYQDSSLSFDIIFGSEEPEPEAIVAGGDIAFTASELLTNIPTGLAQQQPESAQSVEASEPFDSQGQVLGAEDEGENDKGLNALLLLIPPVALVLSIPFVSPGARNAVIPTVGTGVTAVLGYYSKGDLAPNIFWAILVLELIIILILDYLIAEKVISEVVQEEKVLEKKEKRAHKQHK